MGIMVMEELTCWHGSVRASGGEAAIHNAARLGGPAVVTVAAGLARVAVRSTGQPGEIGVEATSEGFKAVKCLLKASRCQDINRFGGEE
jgi:hypothetical protein